MGDALFPPPQVDVNAPKKSISKWLLIGSHLLTFLGGFIGGGHTPAILKGAGELLGQAAK